MEQARQQTQATNPFADADLPDFLEQHVYDPEGGGLLRLHDEHRLALRHLSQLDPSGSFRFQDWIFSAPKKSGKTTIAAGVVLWWAWQIANGQCYVIGNDLKQADSRMFRVIEYAVTHHPQMRHHADIVRYKIKLSNGTVIEALPLDPTGEAGMNPTVIAWTEAWGAKGGKAELMWTEAALSPTRAGKSFRLVESYAGHSGESLILERLYNSVVKPDYAVDPDHELYANRAAGIAAYWCTRKIQPWQLDGAAKQYYASEDATKPPLEVKRQHANQWVTSEDVFVPIEWWDSCAGDLPPTQADELWVIALDAATSNDCFALVAATRRDDMILIRQTHIWSPPPGGKLDFAEPERVLRDLCAQHAVACVVYDPYQLHDMATRLKREGIAWFEEMNQGAPRLEADKALHDRIRDRRIRHDGNPTLREHIRHANKKIEAEGQRLRIIKRNEASKIDAAVALSMAAHQAAYLNIG